MMMIVYEYPRVQIENCFVLTKMRVKSTIFLFIVILSIPTSFKIKWKLFFCGKCRAKKSMPYYCMFRFSLSFSFRGDTELISLFSFFSSSLFSFLILLKNHRLRLETFSAWFFSDFVNFLFFLTIRKRFFSADLSWSCFFFCSKC